VSERLMFLKKHLVWIVITILLFVAGLISPETRYHILVEVWGVGAAGVLVMLIFEWYSDDLRNEIWLRKNRTTIQPVIEGFNGTSVAILNLVLMLSPDIFNQLNSGNTLEERKKATEQIRELCKEINEGQTAYAQEVVTTLPSRYRLIDNVVNVTISAPIGAVRHIL